MVRNAREENSRRGGFVRIFPTAETWSGYGYLLEYSSQNNLILHEHLYPAIAKRKTSVTSRGSAANNGSKQHQALFGASRGGFEFFR